MALRLPATTLPSGPFSSLGCSLGQEASYVDSCRTCERGGIGRRAGFRSRSLRGWRFESSRSHEENWDHSALIQPRQSQQRQAEGSLRLDAGSRG